jgi:L-2-hydroxyglutarate oxidase
MGMRYWRSAVGEVYRSLNKAAFVASLRQLLPEIREADLVADGAGVRAQAVRRDGYLVDDFKFVCSENMLHVWNVPSPAATASLPIGREIVRMVKEGFGL